MGEHDFGVRLGLRRTDRTVFDHENVRKRIVVTAGARDIDGRRLLRGCSAVDSHTVGKGISKASAAAEVGLSVAEHGVHGDSHAARDCG